MKEKPKKSNRSRIWISDNILYDSNNMMISAQITNETHIKWRNFIKTHNYPSISKLISNSVYYFIKEKSASILNSKREKFHIMTEKEIANIDLNSEKVKSLIKMFENETGKYAIWQDKITEGFKKWLLGEEIYDRDKPNVHTIISKEMKSKWQKFMREYDYFTFTQLIKDSVGFIILHNLEYDEIRPKKEIWYYPEKPPEMKRFETETRKPAIQNRIITDDFKIWIKEKYPDLTKIYPPLIIERVLYKGQTFKVYNTVLAIINKDIGDINEIEGFNKLKTVRILHLSKNKIREINSLENLSKLEELYLHGNQITEIKGLEKLTNLRRLDLNNNLISEIKGFENLINLKELYLNGNQIIEIKGLEKLINLMHLELNDNLITELKGLNKLSNLEWLKLNNNPISEIKDFNLFPPNLSLINMYPNSLPKEQYLEICRKYSIPSEEGF